MENIKDAPQVVLVTEGDSITSHDAHSTLQEKLKKFALVSFIPSLFLPKSESRRTRNNTKDQRKSNKFRSHQRSLEVYSRSTSGMGRTA